MTQAEYCVQCIYKNGIKLQLDKQEISYLHDQCGSQQNALLKEVTCSFIPEQTGH